MPPNENMDALAQAFAREMVAEVRELRASIDRLTKAVLIDAQAKLVAPAPSRPSGAGIINVATQIADLLRNLRV